MIASGSESTISSIAEVLKRTWDGPGGSTKRSTGSLSRISLHGIAGHSIRAVSDPCLAPFSKSQLGGGGVAKQPSLVTVMATSLVLRASFLASSTSRRLLNKLQRLLTGY